MCKNPLTVYECLWVSVWISKWVYVFVCAHNLTPLVNATGPIADMYLKVISLLYLQHSSMLFSIQLTNFSLKVLIALFPIPISHQFHCNIWYASGCLEIPIKIHESTNRISFPPSNVYYAYYQWNRCDCEIGNKPVIWTYYPVSAKYA